MIKKCLYLLLSITLFVLMITPANAVSYDQCRLQENSYPRNLNNHLYTAFPSLNYNIPSTGDFTIAVIPVHFIDLPADADPYAYIQKDMDMFVEYFDVQSYGKVSFKWRKLTHSVLLSGLSQDYAQSKSSFDTSFAQKALLQSDHFFDYTNIQNVIFLLPRNQQILPYGVQGFYGLTHSQKLRTNESLINNYLLAGRYFVDNSGHAIWSYWAHELLHGFSLPDLYPQPWSPTVKNLRPEVVDGWGAYNGWDIMADQDGPSRSISLWTKWTLGWLNEDQVLCQLSSQFINQRVSLVYNEDFKVGTKAVIIPFNNTKALVIESRRETKFNRQLIGDNLDDGVLIYEIDSTLGHGEMPIIPIKRNSKLTIKNSLRTPAYYDALLDVGEVVQYQNLYIKYVSNVGFDNIIISTSPILDEVKPSLKCIKKSKVKNKKICKK